jgi:Ca-activated chloride channel family protein
MKTSGSRWLLAIPLLLSLFAEPVLLKSQEKKTPVSQLAVKLNVTVVDPAGRPISNLTSERFRVLEDGVQQDIIKLEPKSGPLVFELTVDCSGSMRSVLDKVVRVAKLVVENMNADDECSITRFVRSDNIKRVQDFTGDKVRLKKVLDEFYVEDGRTALVDAVYFANEHLLKHTNIRTGTRRSIVLITDGEDRDSYYKKEQLFSKLEESGVQVFVIGFGSGIRSYDAVQKATRFVNQLAVQTGGVVYRPDLPSDAEKAVKAIISEMSASYVLSYNSTNPTLDGKQRQIKVEVIDPSLEAKATVFVRDSYTAPKK